MKSEIKEVRQHGKPNVVFLVGNKLDKEGDRKVARQEAEDFAQQNGINFFMEISTQSGKSITNLFFDIAEQLMEKVNHGNIVAKKILIKKGRKGSSDKSFGWIDDPYKYIEGLNPGLSYTQLDKEFDHKMDVLMEESDALDLETFAHSVHHLLFGKKKNDCYGHDFKKTVQVFQDKERLLDDHESSEETTTLKICTNCHPTEGRTSVESIKCSSMKT